MNLNIHTDHPPVLDFKANEVRTLNELYNRRLVKEFPDLDNSIYLAKYNYKDLNALNVKDFEFHTNFPIEIERHHHQIYIEARIRGDYDEATYLLAINDKNDPEELVRKFHFDFAHPTIQTNQPVPIFHLQYGGKLSHYLQSKGVKDNKIDHGLSVPRLNYTPINLVILLDMAFRELGTAEIRKLTEKFEWRELVYRNEMFILEKYYRAIARFCTTDDYAPKKKLIRDFCYGQ